MRVVVVDDEPLARRGIRKRLANHPDMEIVAECANGKAALAAIRSLAPDLVFLDIKMPDMTGFELLYELVGRNEPRSTLPFIIFLTAFDSYALDAFRVHALDYLLKPIEEDRLASALDHARAMSRSDPEMERRVRHLIQQAVKMPATEYVSRFAVRTGARIAIVPVDEVDWIESSGDYVTLHTRNKAHLLRETLTSLESQLDPERFIRVHRSAMVQPSRIRELVSLDNREFRLRLVDGTELRVSRTYSERLLRWL